MLHSWSTKPALVSNMPEPTVIGVHKGVNSSVAAPHPALLFGCTSKCSPPLKDAVLGINDQALWLQHASTVGSLHIISNAISRHAVGATGGE